MYKYPPNFIKLYCDLDGVLTNFQGAVKNLTGHDLDWDDPEEKKIEVYKAIDRSEEHTSELQSQLRL